MISQPAATQLLASLKELLPILERQLQGLELAAEQADGGVQLRQSVAYQTASARLQRARDAIKAAEV